MIRRTLVIGDIHGHYDALREVLNKASFNPLQDRLIGLGDYVDGWHHSYEVVALLLEYQKLSPHPHVFISGNHDMMFCQTLQRLIDGISMDTLINELPESYRDELRATLDSYLSHPSFTWEHHLNHFYKRLPFYHLENNSLFVHAGFVPELGLEGTHLKDPNLLLTDRTMYHEAHDHYLAGDPKHFGPFQTIFIGHTPTFKQGEVTPILKGNVLNLDQGCKVNGRLTIWEIETGQYWQCHL